MELLNIGDTVITKSFLGETRFPITRVTKTLAISKRATYEHRFKREISHNMSHPYEQYCCVDYRVETGEK
jgi:hypothetical protein